MRRRSIFRECLLDVLMVWGAVVLGVALAVMLLVLTSCGSPSRGSVAEPPSPPVTPPPVQPPPPPHVVVRDVTVSVTLAGHPVSSARVILAPGVDAATDAHGVARFAYLDAGAYAIGLDHLPLLASAPVAPVIEVSPEARTFAVEIVADIGDGQIVLLGDSDSAEPSDFRGSSVDDYLAGAATLAGWGAYRHSNGAQPCTSAAPTGCEHRAIEQVRDLTGDTAIVVTRWGLNDVHYQVGPETFASHYADALDEVIARGAVPVVVAIQAEEDPAYRGRRDAYNRALAALAAERGAVYVDPGITWNASRELFADDGTHLNDAGTRVVADAVLDGLTRALTVGTLVVEPPVEARACPRFGDGFVLGVSYYGLASFAPGDVASDLPWLRSLGVCLLRVWLDWSVPDDGARVVRSDGSVREDRWADLASAADLADGLGMQLDLTLGDGLDGDAARERALDTIARRFAGRDVVAVVDAWNEIDSELSVSGVEGYVRAVKRADPGRLVTVSISGEWDAIIDRYERIDHVVDLVAPHSPRKDEWWQRLAPGIERLEAATGLLAYAQEEARELYHGTDHWPVEAYVGACQSMCELGVPYVQHSEAGFDGSRGSWRAQVDATTLAALTAMSADRCGCAS